MTFDVITVGGGLGGAAIARAMAERGARVLVLERERRFTDRVRGEALLPWGLAEARALGLEGLLRSTCAHELPWNDLYVAGMQVGHRDLAVTTPQGLSWITFYHPAMQEVVLEAAASAGADVRRGARVRDVEPGVTPAVAGETDGRVERIAARLVVGADGRGSRVRAWAGFAPRHDPARLLFSGVLLDAMAFPDDTGAIFFHPGIGRISLLFPQGGGRVRAYVGHHKDADVRRKPDLAVFVEESVRAGTDATWFAGAHPAGPLATFDGADTWVEHPFRAGVALLGDAAATSDPTWGQGMSLTLRDVRTLRDALLAGDDWTAAGDAYAAEHDRYYDVIHRTETWYADVFMEPGAEADARRECALPLIAADPTRIPDALFGGPELGADDSIRRRFFGEE